MTRIESSVGNGVPDTVMHTKIGHIFVEFKYIKEYPKRAATLLKLPLRPEQKIWIDSRGKISGDVWVFVRVADDFYLFPWFVAVRLYETGWDTVQWKRIPHWTGRCDYNDVYRILTHKEEKHE